MNSVSWQAEVLWTRLIVTVDDFGRCEANPKLLRAKLFPLRLDVVRESDMPRWLAECEKAGLVRLYQVDGKSYLQMNKWEKGRAEKSRYPDPAPLQAAVRKCLQPSTDAPDSDSDSDNDTDTAAELSKTAAVTPESFAEEWNRLPEPFPGVRSMTDGRRTALRARLKEAFWVQHWREALTRITASAFCRGEGKDGWIANVDFFLRPESVAKIIEGKYDDAGGQAGETWVEQPPVDYAAMAADLKAKEQNTDEAELARQWLQ